MDELEFQSMIAVDDRHWWYRGRRRVVVSQLERLDLPPNLRVLDAGCGSGRTLDELDRFGAAAGCDLNPSAVAAAERRGHSDVRVGRLEDLPYGDAEFDLVTCLDVVEHVRHDADAFRELRRVTRPGGRLLVTVPAYQWLWSQHDVANHHFRRYNRDTLIAAAEAAGWRRTHDSYFFGWLLPAAAALRLAKRAAHRVKPHEQNNGSELNSTPAVLHGVLERCGRAESRWLARGHRLPAGLSLLAVFENPA